MLSPMLAAEWQHIVLNFSTEYHNSIQNIIILFWKYADIRSEAWLCVFWEDIWKIVCSDKTGILGWVQDRVPSPPLKGFGNIKLILEVGLG
jgi:hypothetical protein